MRKRPFVTFLCAGSLLLGASGCPDPQGQFDDFQRRFEVIGPKQVAGLCLSEQPDPMVSGSYFFSLTPTVSPDKPAPFIADVQTDGSEFTFTLTPVNADDRSTIVTMTAQGDPVMPQTFGPFLVEDGVSTVELVDAFVPGDSNPLSENNLTVQATLEMAFCADDPSILCGTFAANVTAPFALDLAGTFAFEARENDMNPEPPVVDCDGRQAAPF